MSIYNIDINTVQDKVKIINHKKSKENMTHSPKKRKLTHSDPMVIRYRTVNDWSTPLRTELIEVKENMIN